MNNNQKLERITLREKNFAQWYTDIVERANLISYGPVKGTMILKPYGYAIWENIQKLFDFEFKKIGVQNVYFPMLIPKSLFSLEQDHIFGFAPELATVTKVGQTKLEEELYLRPTSEALFGSFFSKEIQGYRDLPLLYNQWVNVIRWEKNTRPFLRTSEFLWQEGHTIHSTAEEAKNFTLSILNIYARIVSENLLLPIIKGKKTEHEKFAGAQETYTIESLMFDGQALQCGTSHYFAQNFTKPFNIKFTNKENKLEYAYSTSWGVSTRLIGALIMTHSDDHGLVLPFNISPEQIVIIPIKKDPVILEAAYNLKKDLSRDYRVIVDNSDKSLGFRAANAEIKGIPLRIEIGLNELESSSVMVVRRDDGIKKLIKLSMLAEELPNIINSYDTSLFSSALKNREQHTFRINSFKEYKEKIKNNNGLYLAPFCNTISCEAEIKTLTQTVSRCIPFSFDPVKDKCFKCGNFAQNIIYFGRAY